MQSEAGPALPLPSRHLLAPTQLQLRLQVEGGDGQVVQDEAHAVLLPDAVPQHLDLLGVQGRVRVFGVVGPVAHREPLLPGLHLRRGEGAAEHPQRVRAP